MCFSGAGPDCCSLTVFDGAYGAVRRGAAAPCVVKQVNNTLVSASGSLCVYVLYSGECKGRGGAGSGCDSAPTRPPIPTPSAQRLKRAARPLQLSPACCSHLYSVSRAPPPRLAPSGLAVTATCRYMASSLPALVARPIFRDISRHFGARRLLNKGMSPKYSVPVRPVGMTSAAASSVSAAQSRSLHT